jgi:hypothetical protein
MVNLPFFVIGVLIGLSGESFVGGAALVDVVFTRVGYSLGPLKSTAALERAPGGSRSSLLVRWRIPF